VRKELRRWLRQFHDETGLTTIFVTHDQEEALEIADELVILHHGRIEQIGTPQKIYDEPGSAFVCEFLGDVNRVEHWRGSTSPTYVRPHEIEIVFAAEASAESRGRVLHLFAAGPIARLNLRLPDGQRLEAEIPRAQLESMALGEGDEVGVRFRAARRFREHQ
jgi:sulfate transport system ATP-binding protein